MSYGEPEDVQGECNARLHIADNFHDNHATMRCQREPGHEGRHREVWRQGKAVVEWEGCDRAEEEAARKAEEADWHFSEPTYGFRRIGTSLATVTQLPDERWRWEAMFNPQPIALSMDADAWWGIVASQEDAQRLAEACIAKYAEKAP